jgi:thiamine biosynthesis lipoprotein
MLGMWCCVLPWLLLAGCQSSPANKALPITRLQPHLGTFVSITVYAEPGKAQPAINAAFDEFRAVDALLSIHRDDSDLARANAGGPVNAELQAVLEKSLAIARDTDGAFDPTIRPLADLWGFIKKEGYRLPRPDELRAVLPRVDYRKVSIRNNRLHFATPSMSIDPGGFGKGYAVDRAIATLQRQGITRAMVKAGGDLRVIGLPPGQRHWTIYLEDPKKKGYRLAVQLKSGALSTSGNYENFFEIDGQRYGHLLDPRTGRPIQAIAACTLTAPTCLESDAYATAACVLGVEKSKKEFGQKFGMRFVTLLGVVVKSNWQD